MEPEIFNNLPNIIHWLDTALSSSLLLGRMDMTMLQPFAIQDCDEEWMDVFDTVECSIDTKGKWLWRTKGQGLGTKKDMAKVRGHHILPPAQPVQKPIEVGTVWGDPILPMHMSTPTPWRCPYNCSQEDGGVPEAPLQVTWGHPEPPQLISLLLCIPFWLSSWGNRMDFLVRN